MKKCAFALLLLAACKSSTQVRLERDLEEAARAEQQGDYLRAVQIYESCRGRSDDPKLEPEIDRRSRAAADKAMAQGEQMEAEGAHLRAAQFFEKLHAVAHGMLGERVTTALARARNAAYEKAVAEGRAHEGAGRYREAVASYESVATIAEKLGKGAELATLLDSARRGHFDAEVAQGKAAAERRDWARAVSIYEGIRPTAQKIGRTAELDDLLTQAFTGWYSDAGDKAAGYVRSREWDRAIQTYESARRAARAIGREEELDRAIADAKVSRGLDRGQQYEERQNWSEAIRTYEEIQPLAQKTGRAEEVEQRLTRCREKRYDQAMANGEQFERSGDWSRALAEYRSVENIARMLGRSDELNRRIANVRVREALAQGEALESQGRWRDAIRRYEEIEPQARDVGLGEEVARRLASARSGLVRAERDRAQEHARRGDYQAAIDTLLAVRELARQIGEDQAIDQDIHSYKGKRFDQALEQARAMRNDGDFDGALRFYESMRALAREIGREDELDRHVRLCAGERFDQSCAHGRRLEQEGRWDEAIQYYQGLSDLARSAGQEEALRQHILRCRNGRFDAALAAARECERQDDWSGAIAHYERLLGWADDLGRREEVQGYIRVCREELALLNYPHGSFEEHSWVMPGDVTAMAFDSAGTRFAVGDSTGQVWVYDLSDHCTCSYKLDAQNKVHDVAISPDGQYVAATAVRSVTVWDTRRGRRLVDFDVADEAHAIAFSPDGTEVLVGRENGTVEAWVWRNSRKRMAFRGHRSCVNWIGWLPGNKHFVTVCQGGEARRWDWDAGECRASMTLSEQGVRHASFGARWMGTVEGDSAIGIYDPTSFQSHLRLQTSGPTVCALVGRDRFLMVADATGSFRAYNVRRREMAHHQEIHKSAVTALLLHPDGYRFATASKDRDVKLWQRRR